ncbi:ABC transporter permease [Lachnobacterium bovis]|uniref:ABC-2 type transport system permease protein n=1 Tax=Lachnobacterium bovis TaxID=140626 RepID=A0A1H9TAC7_9FIRM|nr:ABC transporter permease [Lachnobacterium bovis]SER94076.1 ABC-2 type transport system permease protein [Lachnobacterium bovis]
MQVYNLFLKIFKSKIGQIVMYIVIFLGITMLFLSKTSNSPSNDYKAQKLVVSINDKDNSLESKLLRNYISRNTKKYEISALDKETIQDDLFFRNVDAVIIIPKGFSKSFNSNNITSSINTYTLPNTMTANLTKNLVNKYLSTALSYHKQGYSSSESLIKAEKNAKIHGNIKLVSKKTTTFTMRYYFFSYLGYILICTCFVSGIPILKVLNSKKIDARIQCSSYRFSKKNFEIFLGIATLGLIVFIIFTILSFIILKKDVLTINGALLFLNAFGYIIMVLSLVYLFGQLVKKDVYVSGITNIVALCFSFLGGIFIPLNYLSDTVLKIAHFLPSYWYIRGCEFAENYNSGSFIETFHYISIELIYALVFYLIAVTIIKMKAKNSI